MGGDNPRRLVVEGYDDLYSVREIMRTHIEWPDTNESEYPVYIDIGYGVNEILNENYMGVLLKSPTIKNLGIMIDADEKRAWQRYRSLYDLCRASFPDMPDTLPFEGLVVNNAPAEKRLASGSCLTIGLKAIWRRSCGILFRINPCGSTQNVARNRQRKTGTHLIAMHTRTRQSCIHG